MRQHYIASIDIYKPSVRFRLMILAAAHFFEERLATMVNSLLGVSLDRFRSYRKEEA
jgi:hypothetical protein